VHQVARYDTDHGISYWTKNYHTAIEADDELALSREYPYYDPIYMLPEPGQAWWLDEARAPATTFRDPWGLEAAPKGFGPFGGKLLVGNFGNGRIHAYGLFSGRPDGTLRTKHHKPITIDGLWALQFSTATTGGTGTLLFSAGLNDEADGLVGAINPAL
jgi:hypothetical protein